MEPTHSGPHHYKGYQCGICYQRFNHPSLIYSCNHQHYFCQKCYNEEYYEGKDPICPHRNCKSHIYRMDRKVASKRERGLLKGERGRKMFPDVLKLSQELREEEMLKSLPCLYRGDCVKTLSCISLTSKRPVQCPYPGCERTIAVTAVDSHFKYEHKSVPFVRTYFGSRNTFKLNPFHIQYDQKHCIALIQVHNVEKEDEPKVFCRRKGTVLHSHSNAPTPLILIMASRIQCHNVGDELDDDDYDYYEENNTGDYKCRDNFLIWVASTTPTTLRYTIVGSALPKIIRLKREEYIAQVSDNYLKLFHGGRGLILTYAQAVGLSVDATRPMDLDLVLHKEEPG